VILAVTRMYVISFYFKLDFFWIILEELVTVISYKVGTVCSCNNIAQKCST